MTNPRQIKFAVSGDPVPYLRITQGQMRLMRVPDQKLDDEKLKVKRSIEKYMTYKSAVYWAAVYENFQRKPKDKVFMNVVIYFSSGQHGDPDNIRKGIQDAVFENDNKVAGSVDFFYDPKNPRVEVEIFEP